MPYKSTEDGKKYMRKYNKQYRQEHEEERREYDREYHKEHKTERGICNKKWRNENKEHLAKYRKSIAERRFLYIEIWRRNNRERIRKYREQWYKRNSEIGFNLKFILNNRIRKAIYKSLKGNKAGRHWEVLVGYTLSELREHLERTMPKGYIWGDYLGGKLHIDHRIPILAFNFTKPGHIDFKRCWALKNLRLLPARENLRKGSKLSRPFQSALRI